MEFSAMRKLLFLITLFSGACIYAEEHGIGAEGKTLLMPISPRDEIARTLFQHRRSGAWSENFAQALAEAQNSGKVLLLAFMGAGWCPWSEKLEREILSEPAFLEPLRIDVQFVWLACPEESKRYGSELKQLKEKYGVDEFPTLVVITPQQEEMFKVGYLPLSAKEFAARLKQMVGDFKELFGRLEKDLTPMSLEELESLYIKARDLKSLRYKERLMEEGLKQDKGTFFLLEKYAELVEAGNKKEAAPFREKIIERDPKNLKGSQLRLAIFDFQTRATRLKRKGSPHTVVKPLLEYIAKFGEKDKENLWKVRMMMAQYLFTKNEVKDALEHASASYQTAPEESKKEISETIDYLKTYIR